MLNVRAIAHTIADDARRVDLIGGHAAADRIVSSVVTVSAIADVDQLSPNALVIVPAPVARSGEVGLDILIRRAAAARVSCLVVDAGSNRVPLSTERLSTHFRIALWRESDLDADALRSRIEHLVRNPDMAGATTVRALSGSLLRPAGDLGELVSRLGTALGCAVGLIGADGGVVAGAALADPAVIAPRLARSSASGADGDIVVETADDQRVFLTPAFPLVTDGPRFWIGAVTPPGLEVHTSHIPVSLHIGALALSAHLSQSSLTYERDNRGFGVMLRDLQSHGSRLSAAEIEQATASGWQLFGWHAAVQVRVDSAITGLPVAAIAFLFADVIRRQSIRMRPVVAGRVIVFWESWPAYPEASDLELLESRVQRAVREVEQTYVGVRVRAGIGTPREGPSGIGASIDDARSAVAFAEAQRGSAVVRRADRMTAHRLIEDWLPDSATREAVLELIAPLRRADSGDQLTQTLRTYLDLESNTSETATALGVHRNTVLQRLNRIRDLLPVDLDDASSRLAVQLALRLIT